MKRYVAGILLAVFCCVLPLMGSLNCPSDGSPSIKLKGPTKLTVGYTINTFNYDTCGNIVTWSWAGSNLGKPATTLGARTVKLTGTDNQGRTASDTLTVTVYEDPLVSAATSQDVVKKAPRDLICETINTTDYKADMEFTESQSKSITLGVNVTAGFDVSVVETKIQGTYERTGTGRWSGKITVKDVEPGGKVSWYMRKCWKQDSGKIERWKNDGVYESGTWVGKKDPYLEIKAD